MTGLQSIDDDENCCTINPHDIADWLEKHKHLAAWSFNNSRSFDEFVWDIRAHFNTTT